MTVIRVISLVFLALLLHAFGHNPTLAQSSIDAEQIEKPVPINDLPQILLDEADEVFRDCDKTPEYTVYYDCSCISYHFIQERIKRGPDAERIDILNAVFRKCPDTPRLAGEAYDRCIERQRILGRSNDEYCACFANEYAKTLAKSLSEGGFNMNGAIGAGNNACGQLEKAP